MVGITNTHTKVRFSDEKKTTSDFNAHEPISNAHSLNGKHFSLCLMLFVRAKRKTQKKLFHDFFEFQFEKEIFFRRIEHISKNG
jgi:hypothetical protein